MSTTDTSITVVGGDGTSQPVHVTNASTAPVNVTSVSSGAASDLGKAEDAAHASGDVGVAVLARRIDTIASSAGTSGDYATINVDSTGRLWERAQDDGPSWTSVFGVAGARFTSADQSAAVASVTDAPTSTQKLVITDVLVSVGSAIRVDLKEETSGTIIASLYLAANSVMQWTPRSKLKLATADKKLQVQTSGAGNVAVTAHYYSEA